MVFRKIKTRQRCFAARSPVGFHWSSFGQPAIQACTNACSGMILKSSHACRPVNGVLRHEALLDFIEVVSGNFYTTRCSESKSNFCTIVVVLPASSHNKSSSLAEFRFLLIIKYITHFLCLWIRGGLESKVRVDGFHYRIAWNRLQILQKYRYVPLGWKAQPAPQALFPKQASQSASHFFSIHVWERHDRQAGIPDLSTQLRQYIPNSHKRKSTTKANCKTEEKAKDPVTFHYI